MKCWLYFPVFALLVGIRGEQLYMSLNDAMKQEHETFMVICRDKGGQSVDWRGPKGNILGVKSRPHVEVSSYGAALIFTEVTASESGVYTCHSKTEVKRFNLTVTADESVNSVGYKPYKPTKPPTHYNTPRTSRYPTTTSTDTTISNISPGKIEFMDHDTELKEIEGRNTFVRCEVKGSTEVVWYKEGNLIERNASQEENKYVIAEDGLLIKNLSREDSGNYTCSALNSDIGDAKNRNVYLTILYKPVWTTSGDNETYYGVPGSFVNLTCEVEANPKPKFQWSRKTSSGVKIAGKNSTITIPEETYKSILQLMVDRNSLGDYECKVANSVGIVRKRFTLKKGTLPNPPQFLEMRGENSNLIDLGIGPPEPVEEEEENMAPVGYNVIYRPVDDQEWQSQDFNLSEENSYPLLELQHDTLYEVQAATRNLAGLSEYTNSSFFRTLKNAVDGVYNNSSYLNVFLGIVMVLLSAFA